MDYILQEINLHKTRLMNLINNLFNTQLINKEIFFNNEIKKESECLISLLNQKQQNLLGPMNNNMNFNPLMFQPNPMINPLLMNVNPIQMGQQQIMQNDLNFNDGDNDKIIDVIFQRGFDSNKFTIQCKHNEKISELINKYREKAGDYNDNSFLYNGQNLIFCLNKTVSEIGIGHTEKITVCKVGALKSGVTK